MSVQFARPDVSELVFYLFGRSVHPELMTVHAETTIWQDDYSATISIADDGHVLSFRCRGETVTEVTAARTHPLPQRRQFLEKRIRGSRDEALRFDNGVRYQVSYQVEQLDLEVFLNVHEELTLDCREADVGHSFPAAGRLSPSPLSFVTTDVWPDSLLIHAFHTFPENRAIVKTQSLFEL